MPHERFLVNHDNKVIHDTEHLQEPCNTDQVERKEYVAPAKVLELIDRLGYRACLHCRREEKTGE